MLTVGDEISASQRVDAFVDAMGWDTASLPAWEDEQEQSTALEEFLIESNFEHILRKFDLVDSTRSFVDLHKDLAVYGGLFHTLRAYNPLFRLLLKMDAEMFYKAVMTATRLRNFPHSDLDEFTAEVCEKISDLIDETHDRCTLICAYRYLDLFVHLPARELHLVLRRGVRLPHSATESLFHPRDAAFPFYVSSAFGQRPAVRSADSSIVAFVRRIPVEFHPH